MKEYSITSRQLREKFFAFFQERGHARIPALSMVPEHDPTALFITAGMQPLVPYLLGERHPAGPRLMNVQRCFRTDDIDQVGNTTHLTFFEMLGNWSLGDYGRAEMIPWSWEFLTGERWLHLAPERLYVTVFEGDGEVPGDEESVAQWQEQFARAGINARPGERIFRLGRDDNWWGPVGQTGPCGPDTEMFFDTGRARCSPQCRPGCACGKYVEIWNDVFMDYHRKADGSHAPLDQKNVDTGMGMARTLAALNGLESVFETDLLAPLVERIAGLSGKPYPQHRTSFRIVADHVTAACFLVADGVVPANVEQGYVLRRLIRRAIGHGRKLGLPEGFWVPLFEVVETIYGDTYPMLADKQSDVVAALEEEEGQFARTLEKGLKKFAQVVEEGTGDGIISGGRAFDLFATYGFPLEMTRELARERGLRVDEEGFRVEFSRHQELSRQGAEQKFSGGLADHSEQSTRYHTATHLLHAALRRVLGPQVEQRGSNITSERLRFDFSHSGKMTPEALRAVEDLVNAAIDRDYPVGFAEVSVEEARQRGAIGLFGDHYGTSVKVYTIGDPGHDVDADPEAPTFSREICGGPHVLRTGLLGKFRIVKEQSASQGIRRVRAVLE